MYTSLIMENGRFFHYRIPILCDTRLQGFLSSFVLSYYVYLRSEFRVVISVTISA